MIRMHLNNLPPGVTNGMIEDQVANDSAFEVFLDNVWEDLQNHRLTVEEAQNIWDKSLKQYLKLGCSEWEKRFDNRIIKIAIDSH